MFSSSLYCSSSALCSLYLQRQRFSSRALALADSWCIPLPYRLQSLSRIPIPFPLLRSIHSQVFDISNPFFRLFDIARDLSFKIILQLLVNTGIIWFKVHVMKFYMLKKWIRLWSFKLTNITSKLKQIYCFSAYVVAFVAEFLSLSLLLTNIIGTLFLSFVFSISNFF